MSATKYSSASANGSGADVVGGERPDRRAAQHVGRLVEKVRNAVSFLVLSLVHYSIARTTAPRWVPSWNSDGNDSSHRPSR